MVMEKEGIVAPFKNEGNVKWVFTRSLLEEVHRDTTDSESTRGGVVNIHLLN